MKILRGPSDEETFSVLNKLSAEEIFQVIKSKELDEKWYELAVSKGLLNGLSSEEILYKSAEGGSLMFVKAAYMKLLNLNLPYLNDLLDDAMILGANNGHLNIVQFLHKKGADINLAYINSNDHQSILNYSIQNGARISNEIIDKVTGESHSLCWFMLRNINKAIAEYLDGRVQEVPP